MSINNNISNLLKDLNFHEKEGDYEDDFVVSRELDKQGVMLSEYSSRFKTIKSLVSHLENSLNQKPVVVDNEYTFNLNNKNFNSITIYKEKEEKKLWITKRKLK